MCKPITIALMLALTLAAASQASAQAPASSQSTTQPATTRPVAFDTHTGYFVSNKFEPDQPESFLILRDQKAFDAVFGTAMVMGDKSHRLPPDVFDSKFVVAVIKRGRATWQFTVKDVALATTGGAQVIRYTAVSQKSDSAEFSCPLIITIPRDIYPVIRFDENGKSVKTIELSYAQEKQAFADEALNADAVLNKVYKQLLTVLDDREKNLLITAQRNWIAFRDTECEFEARYTGSGTDAAMNYPATAQRLTEARTADLRQVLHDRSPKGDQ